MSLAARTASTVTLLGGDAGGHPPRLSAAGWAATKRRGVAWLCSAGLGLAAAGVARAGETRCWIDNGALVVAAAYGPIAGDFILDLSQPKSQLHETAAQAAGWTAGAARWSLRLAGQTLHEFAMPVVDLDARAAGFPTNIAGVLGADILGRFTLDLDLAPCRLRLTRGSAPARPGAGPMKIMIVAGVPAVFAAISDGVTARTGWFAIDTASAGSRIAEAGFSRRPPTGVDPSGRTWPPARLRAVSLGGVLLEQTPAGLMNPGQPGLSGALGVAVWSRVRLHIDGRGR